MHAMRYKQRGITLVISLIILMLMTLFAVTSFNLGRSSLEIVGNMQERTHARDAAVGVIETAFSSSQFSATPTAAISGNCGGVAVQNEKCFDINGDGVDDVDVKIVPNPTCLKSEAILNSALDFNNSDDASCAVQAQQNTSGIAGGGSNGASLCGNAVWDITAVATDLASGATASVSSGIAARTSLDDISTYCP